MLMLTPTLTPAYPYQKPLGVTKPLHFPNNNPTLHCLKVCQLPSWVCCPSLFKPGSQGFLVLAFKDPDRMIAPSLIKGQYLYAFSA